MRSEPSTVESPNAISNTTAILAEMAERARAHYGQSTASWLEAAAVLAEARKIAQHGTWRPFLRDAGIPARTASRMLDFARIGIQIGHLAVLTRGEISALISQAGKDFPGPPPDWEYAKALIDAVIEIAAERNFDPGELARFVAEFPAHPVPRAR